jgi:anti-anti-sigma factor
MNSPADAQEGLRIETVQEPTPETGVMVIRLIGSAGLREVDAMAMRFNRLAAARPKVLVIDASQLTFVCSLAIGQIVMLRSGLKTHGGVIRLAGVRAAVADVLSKTRLDTLMSLYPTVDDAIAG